MKSFYILIFLAGAVLSTFAQNWRPITAQEHFHYQADTAHYISHVMMADSVTLDGTDSVFHLNRVAGPCDTCVYYAGAISNNEPQFLLRKAIQHSGGWWEFRDGNDGFMLYTQALVGESWAFRLNGNDTAQVVGADTATTFGIADSVKQIAVGSDTIVLSQQFGILHFPAIDDSLAYTLTGIDHGRKVGENLPGLAEYFDFAIGDVFYSHYGWGQCCPGYGSNYAQKRTILGKSVLGDTLVYTYRSVDWYGADTLDMKIFEGDDQSGIPFHSVYIPLPNVMIQQDVYPMYFGLKSYYGTVLKVNKRADGEICLTNGFTWDDDNMYLYSWMPTLFAEVDSNLFVSDFMQYSFYMATGRGVLLQEISLFESIAYFDMKGYIKNGIVYGNVPEDSLLIGVEPALLPSFTFAPNPANSQVTISLSVDYPVATAVLLDLQGREIRQVGLAQGTATLPIADLPSGLYLLRVQTDAGSSTQKLMIQH